MFRILIAEDDPSTARLLSAILKRDGYEPLIAADGVEALEMFDHNHIDESGFRTPKEGRTEEIAKALNIREENFFTKAETPEEILRLMIWYDWEHGCSGSVPIDTILLFDNFEEVEKLLKEWYSQKEKLRMREITGAKYLEWMLLWPTVKENN